MTSNRVTRGTSGLRNPGDAKRDILPRLEAQGFRTRAIDLPGAGVHAKYPESYRKRPFDASAFAAEMSPNAGVTQADRTRAVVAEIDALGGGGVLVGHSLGGLTVTSVGEAAAERLIALRDRPRFPGESAADAVSWSGAWLR